MEVTIVNWEKYNPRAKVKQTSWLRFQNSIFENPDFFSFTDSEFRCWIYLLCQASKKNRETFLLNFEHAERVGRLKRQVVETTLKKLESIQCIITDATRVQHGCDTDATLRNVTERNETRRNTYAQQVERLYLELYPRKVGKTKGIAKIARSLAGEGDLELLSQAIRNYAEYTSGADQQYIKHFSTFASEWRDWIERKDKPTDLDWAKVFGRPA